MLATVLHRTHGYTGEMILGDGTALEFVNGQAGPTTITFADAQSLTVMGYSVVTSDAPSTGYDTFTDQLMAPVVANASSATSAALKTFVSTATIVNATGTADSAAILAAFNSMKVGGKAVGTLVIKGNAALDTALVLDGGYTDLEADADFTSGDGRHFSIVCEDGSFLPTVTDAKALTLRGFHEPVINVRFQGGGAGRSVTDAAITASAATLTSATAGFGSADVGRTVTVDGAGPAGGPLLTEITAVTNSTTVTVCTTATRTVTGARATITTNALQLENLVGMQLTVHGVNYAGTLCHAETRGVVANRIRLGHVKRIFATFCGRTIAWAGVEAFGSIDQIWWTDNTWGDVWYQVNDVDVVHYEGGAFNTSCYPFVSMVNCAGNHWGTMTFGDRPASEGMIAIYGGAFGMLDNVRCTANMPGANPIYNGLVLVDTQSVFIKTLHTDHCAYGLWSRGGDVVIGQLFSEGSDGRIIQVEPGITRTAPTVIADVRSFFNQKEVAYATSGVTGGLLKVSGLADTANNLGDGSVNLINCQSTSMLVDVSDFADRGQAVLASSVFCATQANLFGVARARLSKPPANHGSPPAAVSGFALNTLQTNTNSKTLNVGVQLHCDPSSGTAAFITVLLGPNGGLAQVSREIRQLPTGVTQSGSTTSDYGTNFRVPPGWVWQINTTTAVTLGSAIGWYE